ncbi:hypothetical protein CPC08DRAFT_707825 [Agrocybe pediades]|nr:hypothetical protein CPC08DRAFT_707825 [Agrocybe pediades]
MGTTASRAFSPDFISSSSFKDMSPARFMTSSNSPPPTSFSTNISNAVSPQRSPLKKSAKSNSISTSPPLPQAPSIVAVPPEKPEQHNVQHSRNSSEAYQAQQQQPYPQYQFSPPQSRPQSQYQQPQAGPPPTMPHAPPSSHHFSPGQTVPAALRKSPSMQSANAPQRGKPRIFAAMEAQENEDSMQAAGPSLPPPVTQQKQVDVSSNQLLQGHPSLNYQQPPSQPQLVNQPPLLPPVEFMTPKSRIEDLPDLYGNSDQRGLSSSSASLLSSSPSKGTSRHVGGSDPLLRTPRSDSVRSLSKPEEPPQQLASPQATPRSRKLSKARSNADTASVVSHSTNVSGPGVPSTPESRRLHTHASHRSISKSRPSTPATQNKGLPVQPEVGIIRVDEDAAKVGVPLDEDPFARVEGVKVLNATTPPPVKENGSMKPSEELNAPTNEGSAAGQNLGKNGVAAATPLTPVSPEDKKKSKRERKSSKAAKSGEIAGSKGKEKEKQVSEPVTLVHFLSDPQLLSTLLSFLSFYDWCTLSAISKQIRIMFVRTPDLREAILESHLKTIGYSRWCWDDKEPLSLSLQDLNDYMRGVSTPNHEYARVAAIYVHSLSIHPNHRDPSLAETVQALTASTRAYTRVLLRLRAQAEKEASVHSLNNSQPPPSASSFKTRTGGTSSRVSSRAPSPTTSMYSHGVAGAPGSTQQTSSASQTSLTFRSPLFKLRRAPLLRVFVPSPEGDWLSDKSVLECEAECKRAGIVHLLRLGDVVWDVAVGDEGNVGRLVWDGSYLIDLDYTYSPVGDLPKYLPTLAFPPSYFHRVIRTGPNVTNPIVHIDISPWGEEIAMNLQLLQDRVRTETPQGAYHNVVRWVHRSSFTVRPSRSTQRYTNTPPKPGQSQSNNGRTPIPDSNGLFVDPGWYGTIVVETEGTNEALADLQDRCGPGAFPPRPRGVNGQMASQAQIENRKVFRILRERSRPGEIWIKAVNVKERLL